MELQIAGTNIELAPAVRRYIERKLGKLSRHLPTIIESRVEISEENTKSPQQHYLVRVTVDSGAGGAVFHGEDRGEDLFKAVDKVTAVMTRQLERHKGKLYDKGRGSSLARGRFDEVAAKTEPKKIVKNKRFILESMPEGRLSSRWSSWDTASFYSSMPMMRESSCSTVGTTATTG